MKNKVLALSAAVLLVSGLAFGFSQSNNGVCCDPQDTTCCQVSDQCPVDCCETDGGTTSEQ